MSDNPPPQETPPTPATPVTTTATAPKGKSHNLGGMALAIAGLVIGAVPVLALVFGKAFTVTTLDGVKSVATAGVVLVAVSGLLALVAVIVSLLRKGTAATAIAAVTLLGMAAFLVTTVLPRVNNLNHLNNVIVPFGKSIQSNCQNPLNKVTADYKQAITDSPTIATTEPVTQILTQLGTFSTAMATDAKTFQQDAANLQTNLTNLQNLSVPDPKYQPLVAGCIKDVQGTLAFLNATTNQQIPTAQFIQSVEAGVTAAPTTSIPAAAKPLVIALTQANIPSSYNAVTLLQAAAQYSACANPFGACSVQLTLPTGVSASAAAQVTAIFYVVLGVGFDQFVNAAMTQAANTTDPQLTAEGNQLKQDIENTLTASLAPINVDAVSIVNNS